MKNDQLLNVGGVLANHDLNRVADGVSEQLAEWRRVLAERCGRLTLDLNGEAFDRRRALNKPVNTNQGACLVNAEGLEERDGPSGKSHGLTWLGSREPIKRKVCNPAVTPQLFGCAG